MNIDILIDRLKALHIAADKARDAFEDIGGVVPDSWIPDYADVLMDAFGVPEESWDNETQSGFSRDYGMDRWQAFVWGEISRQELVDVFSGAGKEQ